MVSTSLGGALLGSIAALLWGDALGRRRELLWAAAAYGAPWLPSGLPWGWRVGGSGLGLVLGARLRGWLLAAA